MNVVNFYLIGNIFKKEFQIVLINKNVLILIAVMYLNAFH